MTLSDIIEFNWQKAIKQHYGKTICDDCHHFAPCTRVILGNYVCHECYVERCEVRETKFRQMEIEKWWERLDMAVNALIEEEEETVLPEDGGWND
jgi:hypothetical protein